MSTPLVRNVWRALAAAENYLRGRDKDKSRAQLVAALAEIEKDVYGRDKLLTYAKELEGEKA